MPGEVIGPDLHLARPRTSPPGYGRREKPPPAEKAVHKEDDYHVELLEYEWPDLPPIPNMKDAICRQKVSKGISYILPVDKAMNSINSTFRTDLRAMFQEPYASEELDYDDKKVHASAQIHFNANKIDTKWSKATIQNLPCELNSESEKARKLYARSAPVTGSRKPGLDIDKMRPRSSLFLPIKTQEHPEAIKLREEVEKIVESVHFEDIWTHEEDDTYAEPTPEPEPEQKAHEKRKSSVRKPSIRYSIKSRGSSGRLSFHFGGGSEKFMKTMARKNSRLKLTARDFKSYEQLKKTKPPKNTIPSEFRSEYLSESRNQEIWDWLHHDEAMTEFEFFLSVCG